MISATDKNNASVRIGSKVRLLELSDYFFDQLPDDESADFKQMIGKEIAVYEIDEYGSVWVEQCWGDAEKGQRTSHSLGLA